MPAARPATPYRGAEAAATVLEMASLLEAIDKGEQ